jgi:hypothetical protein
MSQGLATQAAGADGGTVASMTHTRWASLSNPLFKEGLCLTLGLCEQHQAIAGTGTVLISFANRCLVIASDQRERGNSTVLPSWS